jgi:hypothetical protein
MLSLELQKSPTPHFEKKRGNSPDISKGISRSGMSKFESARPSQAVRRSGEPSLIVGEMPANSGASALLQAVSELPISRIAGSNRRKSQAAP